MYKHPHILHSAYIYSQTHLSYIVIILITSILQYTESVFFFSLKSRNQTPNDSIVKNYKPSKVNPVCPLQALKLLLTKVPNSSEYAGPSSWASFSPHTLLSSYFLPASSNNYSKDLNRALGTWAKYCISNDINKVRKKTTFN